MHGVRPPVQVLLGLLVEGKERALVDVLQSLGQQCLQKTEM